MKALVAWRGRSFLTEGTIGVLSVSFLFLMQVGVYVCVYAHTHTHTAQMGNSDVSPEVGMRHLESPKNPDGLNLGIHIETAGKWQKCNLVSGMASVASNMGWI